MTTSGPTHFERTAESRDTFAVSETPQMACEHYVAAADRSDRCRNLGGYAHERERGIRDDAGASRISRRRLRLRERSIRRIPSRSARKCPVQFRKFLST